MSGEETPPPERPDEPKPWHMGNEPLDQEPNKSQSREKSDAEAVGGFITGGIGEGLRGLGDAFRERHAAWKARADELGVPLSELPAEEMNRISKEIQQRNIPTETEEQWTQPKKAVWEASSHDFPVEVVGRYIKGGEVYAKLSSGTGVPMAEIKFQAADHEDRPAETEHQSRQLSQDAAKAVVRPAEDSPTARGTMRDPRRILEMKEEVQRTVNREHIRRYGVQDREPTDSFEKSTKDHVITTQVDKYLERRQAAGDSSENRSQLIEEINEMWDRVSDGALREMAEILDATTPAAISQAAPEQSQEPEPANREPKEIPEVEESSLEEEPAVPQGPAEESPDEDEPETEDQPEADGEDEPPGDIEEALEAGFQPGQEVAHFSLYRLGLDNYDLGFEKARVKEVFEKDRQTMVRLEIRRRTLEGPTKIRVGHLHEEEIKRGVNVVEEEVPLEVLRKWQEEFMLNREFATEPPTPEEAADPVKLRDRIWNKGQEVWDRLGSYHNENLSDEENKKRARNKRYARNTATALLWFGTAMYAQPIAIAAVVSYGGRKWLKNRKKTKKNLAVLDEIKKEKQEEDRKRKARINALIAKAESESRQNVAV